MTPAIKRSLHHDENHDEMSSNQTASKLPKPSNFKPPAFQPREPVPSVDYSKASFATPLPVQQTNASEDTFIHRPLTHVQPREVYVPIPKMTESETSPIKQSAHISWSNWDEKVSDDEDSHPSPPPRSANPCPPPPPSTKETFNWHSLVKSTCQRPPVAPSTKSSEAMPKFDFDDQSFDELFDGLDA